MCCYVIQTDCNLLGHMMMLFFKLAAECLLKIRNNVVVGCYVSVTCVLFVLSDFVVLWPNAQTPSLHMHKFIPSVSFPPPCGIIIVLRNAWRTVSYHGLKWNRSICSSFRTLWSPEVFWSAESRNGELITLMFWKYHWSDQLPAYIWRAFNHAYCSQHTECCSQVGNTYAQYSRWSSLIYGPKNLPSRQKFLHFSLFLLEMLGYCLEIGHDHFLPYPLEFIVRWLSYHSA